jgi:hypothetical protein
MRERRTRRDGVERPRAQFSSYRRSLEERRMVGATRTKRRSGLVPINVSQLRYSPLDSNAALRAIHGVQSVSKF